MGRISAPQPESFAVSHKSLADLTPDTRNANKGTERGSQMIENSLRQYGAGRSILLDKHGRIIAGNKTAENFGSIGLDDVIVVQTDGTRLVAVQRMDLDLEADPKAKQLAIADNRAGQVSLDWDVDVLKELATEIDLAPFFSADELEAMWPQNAELLTDEDDVPELPEEAVTKQGDLYIMGRHRLLCGDSTSITDVERLMGGEKADMVFTDPPYGVDYEGISNDSRDGLEALLEGSLGNASMASNAGAACYVFHSDRCADIFHMVFRRWCHFSSMVVWVKPSLVMGQSDYHSRHEPCIYGWFSTGAHQWFGDRKQDSIWEAGRERVEGHTTPKPVALIERAISNSSRQGDVVLDVFGGSGSTLIACEKTGRAARLMELDPKYCDVVVARWEAATGQKAVLDGQTA